MEPAVASLFPKSDPYVAATYEAVMRALAKYRDVRADAR
jgi:hypothetical protein